MKALQVSEPHAFRQVRVPVPKLEKAGLDRILVQTQWLSLCGSDIPFFAGGKRNKTYPLQAGAPVHECMGKVIKSTSRHFHPGDLVVAIPEGDHGLAELFIAQASKAVRLPDSMESDGTACLIQPLSTVLNAVDRLGSLEGKTAAVVGLGSIGLLFCWLLRQRGAASILGIDPIESRCRLAERLGAARTLARRSIEVLNSSASGAGDWQPPDICIEAVGHQMETLNDCLGLVRKQGTVLAFGVPDQPVYAVEYETFFRKNLNLVAVVTPEWSEYLEKARDLFLENQAALGKLITHRLPIQEAARAFTLYERHADGIIKVLLSTSTW